jgi:hypothetical protein
MWGWITIRRNLPWSRFAAGGRNLGQGALPPRQKLLITADCGGSNGSRTRLWKVALPRVADEVRLPLPGCHFPPGTSKWNKIEHRLFCFITQNWHRRPLLSRATAVILIASTTTQHGLTVQARLDEHKYETGKRVTKEELAAFKLQPKSFHGESELLFSRPQVVGTYFSRILSRSRRRH